MSERQLGDVGTDMKWEDDHVRVWDLELAPGQSSDWHQHTMPYVFVVTRAGTLLAEYDDGTSAERDYSLGEIVQGHWGSIHRVTNAGSDLYSNSIVEIKQSES